MFHALLFCVFCIAMPAHSTAIQVDLDTLQPRLYVSAAGPVQAVAEYEFELSIPRGPLELTLKGGLRAISPLAAQIICEGIAVDSTGLLWAENDSVYLELRFTPIARDILRVMPQGIADWNENWEHRYPPEWNYDTLDFDDVVDPNEFPLRIRSDRNPPKVLVSRPVPPLPTPVSSLEDMSGYCGFFSWVDDHTEESEVESTRFYCTVGQEKLVRVKYRCATTQVYRKDSEYSFSHDVENGKLIGKYTFQLSGDQTVSPSGLRVCSRSLQENVIATCFWLSPGRFGRWNTPPNITESWGCLKEDFDSIPFYPAVVNFPSALVGPTLLHESEITMPIRPVLGYFHYRDRSTPGAFGCYLVVEPEADQDFPPSHITLPPLDWRRLGEAYPALPLEQEERQRGRILAPCYEGSRDMAVRIGGLKDLDVRRQVTPVQRSGKTVYVLTLEFVSTSDREYCFTWRERQVGTTWVVNEASNPWARRADNHALDIEVTVAPHSTASVRMELGTR